MLIKQDKNSVTFEFDKVYFYYIRNAQNKPVITVCILEYSNVYCRGVAICSTKEAANKKIGRTIAFGRAFNSLINSCDIDYINIDTPSVFNNLKDLFSDDNQSIRDFIDNVVYKSMYDIEFTELEKNLLCKKKEFYE
jgi:hypothetical protein